MLFNNDPMLDELRQIRKRLWEESGHDLHKLADMIRQKTKAAMRKKAVLCSPQADVNNDGVTASPKEMSDLRRLSEMR
jgi:hypothetical protein